MAKRRRRTSLILRMDYVPREPTTSAAHEYRVSSDDIVRVCFLARARTPQRLQETATDVRSIADIRRIFIYNAPSAMTLRGGAAQIALAEWLVNQFDNPTTQAIRSSAAYQYRPSSSVDDVVRILHPAHTETLQALQEMATDVRTIADIRWLFTYSAPHALILRETPARIALAEWLVNELDQPANQPPRTPAPHEYRPSGNRLRIRTLSDYVPAMAVDCPDLFGSEQESDEAQPCVSSRERVFR